MVGEGDAAAQLRAHRLHAVADRQDGHAEPEHAVGGARSGGDGDRGGAARQDDAAWAKGADLLFAGGVGLDLAIDAVLAHPAGDQLGDLAAEIEDQDSVLGFGGHASGSVAGGAARRSKMAAKKPSGPWRGGGGGGESSPAGEMAPQGFFPARGGGGG